LRLRQSILTTRRLPGEQWEASEVPLQKVEIAAARPEEGVVLAPD
jgi:hypothetical protein